MEDEARDCASVAGGRSAWSVQDCENSPSFVDVGAVPEDD